MRSTTCSPMLLSTRPPKRIAEPASATSDVAKFARPCFFCVRLKKSKRDPSTRALCRRRKGHHDVSVRSAPASQHAILSSGDNDLSIGGCGRRIHIVRRAGEAAHIFAVVPHDAYLAVARGGQRLV